MYKRQPLIERVEYVIQTQINPQLASHGGKITLIEITDDGYAVLQFGGGCNGCSMVDVTLKDGVEQHNHCLLYTSLHIVGVLQYGKQAEVLFNDDGHILLVQVGQRIGQEGYLIEKVSKDSVTLQGYKAGQCEQTTSIIMRF